MNTINDKSLASYQEREGFWGMYKIYHNRAVQDGLIMLTKNHTLRLIKELEKLGIVITGIDGESYNSLDVIYTKINNQS